MQSLPTEAKPLTACSQCGTALPPPSGSATFVYGVGAVGYQSCNTCGAKWRYLWQDPPGASGGLSRLPFLLVGAAAVVLVVLGSVLLLRSSTSYTGKSASADTTTPTTPPSSSVTVSTTTAPAIPTQTLAEFLGIIQPVDRVRADFVDFLTTQAVASQQFEVNQQVKDFTAVAQQGLNELKAASWPASAQADVDDLVRASKQFIDDVGLVQYGLQYSASFTDKINADVQNIQQAEARVGAALARPPA